MSMDVDSSAVSLVNETLEEAEINIQVGANIQCITRSSEQKGQPGAKGVVDRPVQGHFVRQDICKKWKSMVPCEKGGNCKSCIQRGIRICARCCVNLPASPEAIQGIEQPRTHETDKAQQANLRKWVIIETLKSSRTLVYHQLWPRDAFLVVGCGIRVNHGGSKV
jgi:hypothetical protein